MTGRHSGDGVTDSSHQPSDVNRHDTTTTTYETPVNYQQLPSPPPPPSSSHVGRQHDYYNVDNSSDNTETPYQVLNVDTLPPVVYQQLGRH